MANTDSRITIHMAASLDGFIARTDGSVDWLETSDEFAGGATIDPAFVEAFLETIDCYVMGSRTYETAVSVRGQGVRVVVRRQADLRPHASRAASDPGHRRVLRGRSRALRERAPAARVPKHLVRRRRRGVGECLRLGLADEVRYSILPVLIGDGIPFFEKLDRDVALHLAEVNAYRSGMVELRYEVRR